MNDTRIRVDVHDIFTLNTRHPSERSRRLHGCHSIFVVQGGLSATGYCLPPHMSHEVTPRFRTIVPFEAKST